MENFSCQKLLDTIKEVSLELFPDPYGHLAGIIAPESQGPVEPCHVLYQGGTIYGKLFLPKVATATDKEEW